MKRSQFQSDCASLVCASIVCVENWRPEPPLDWLNTELWSTTTTFIISTATSKQQHQQQQPGGGNQVVAEENDGGGDDLSGATERKRESEKVKCVPYRRERKRVRMLRCSLGTLEQTTLSLTHSQ